MKKTVRFTLNGRPKTLTIEDDRMLLWVLRTDLGLTGTKYGCGEGYCGACTVVVDGKAVRSCGYPAVDVDGKTVVTIEGLAADGKLHPLQRAFVDHDALQCGYCTSGMIMNAYALLLRKPKPTRAEILDEMEGNLCRCGAHTRIIQAIQAAAEAMAGGATK
jgi:aerobic-type carbon monoxide dehydrogenase small subunit (CoxS/CutS family)